METFSALLAICAGNSPVACEFPTQRPVTRGFDVFFDMRLNEWLSKQSWGWWFETPSRPLWRHSNAFISNGPIQSVYNINPDNIALIYNPQHTMCKPTSPDMETTVVILPLCDGNPSVTDRFSTQRGLRLLLLLAWTSGWTNNRGPINWECLTPMWRDCIEFVATDNSRPTIFRDVSIF